MGSIYIREGSTSWWFRYRDADGKLKRRSSGTMSEILALAQLAKLEAETIEKKAAKGATQANAVFSNSKIDLSLEERVEQLEQTLHRLMIEKDIQILFLHLLSFIPIWQSFTGIRLGI
jgi:hypothetical protein